VNKEFTYDVFLSHSTKDKVVVRELAERLRADGPGIQRLAFSLQPSHGAPLNKERRFIPLRLDDTQIKGSLAQFLYINWRPADRERGYPKLLEACRRGSKSGGRGVSGEHWAARLADVCPSHKKWPLDSECLTVEHHAALLRDATTSKDDNHASLPVFNI
jgi:hypothetical protein